jgi:signal transduction histidine kinase
MSGEPVSSRKTLPLAALLLGVFALALLGWANDLNERQRENFNLGDALADLQIAVASSHLWLEEALTGDTEHSLAMVLGDIHAAMRLCESILGGGVRSDGTLLRPLQESGLRLQAEGIRGVLRDFQAIAIERAADPRRSGIGTPLDLRTDGLFADFQTKARTLELAFEDRERKRHDRTRRLFRWLFAAWMLLFMLAAIGLWNREVKRAQAEEELRIAKGTLEHRVAERTRELEEMNERLHWEILQHGRKAAELGESERQFKQLSQEFHVLLDSIDDPLLLVSSELELLWANRGAARLADGGSAAPERKFCHAICHDRSEPCVDCPALRCFESGRVEAAKIQAPGGRVFPILEETGRVAKVLEVAVDVTAKALLEAEAARASHLASLGELSAGVAHEINNPINGIINCAQILLNKRAADGLVNDLAGRINTEGRRIADIVRGLLSFARDRREEKRPTGVGEILAEALDLTQAQMKKEGIDFRITMPAGLPDVVSNPQQIQQVFMNVISNARHALNKKPCGPDGDKLLEISGEPVQVDGRRTVRVVFLDHGVGIPAAVLPKIMEPFFSTKPAGTGTGLGLSISHGIVSDHGGTLRVESAEGRFTKVIIELPAAGNGHG